MSAPPDSTAVDLEALTRGYLDSFAARDLEGCLRVYAEDASIDFQIGTFRGRRGIEEWHKDRFAANLRLVRLESITVAEEGTVVVDVIAASDRLAAWRIPELSGRVTLRFEGDKVAQARFAPRMMSPIDMIRSG